jgi:hypothetical protein
LRNLIRFQLKIVYFFLKPFLVNLSTLAQTITNLKIMKKQFLAVALILGASTSFSQELAKNKNGKVFNPEAGDWGISVDGTPFINFAADLVHIGAAAGEDAPLFNGLNGDAPTYSISGKYFKSNNMAYRGTIRLYSDNERTTAGITYDPNATAVNWPNDVSTDYKTKDVMSQRDWSVGFGGGLEWRKGTKRLQGYYGGEAIIALARSATSYKYAYDVIAPDTDPATADGLTNYTTDFGSNIVNNPGQYVSRALSQKQAMTTAFGVRGFVGVEYFVAPKISIGGEFGWGMGIAHTGRSSSKVEGVDFQEDDGTAIDGAVVSDVKGKSGDRSTEFFLGSDRENSGASEPKLWMNSFSPGGKLSLNFYF